MIHSQLYSDYELNQCRQTHTAVWHKSRECQNTLNLQHQLYAKFLPSSLRIVFELGTEMEQLKHCTVALIMQSSQEQHSVQFLILHATNSTTEVFL